MSKVHNVQIDGKLYRSKWLYSSVIVTKQSDSQKWCLI